jgi:prophage regulatory protein
MQSQNHSSVESAWWRLPRVMEETGLSRSTIYRLMGQGEFPSNHGHQFARAKVWFEDEVRAWKRAQFQPFETKVDTVGLGELL